MTLWYREFERGVRNIAQTENTQVQRSGLYVTIKAPQTPKNRDKALHDYVS